MKCFFSVKDIGAGFDGLLVEGECNDRDELISITKVYDRDVIVGDRNLSFSFPSNSIFIFRDFLKREFDVEIKSFDYHNPFGKLVWEMNERTSVVNITCARYENILSVVISDSNTNKTLFAKYFTDNIDKIRDLIANRKDSSAEDLVFELNELSNKIGILERE
jgi:hypothetical protein